MLIVYRKSYIVIVKDAILYEGWHKERRKTVYSDCTAIYFMFCIASTSKCFFLLFLAYFSCPLKLWNFHWKYISNILFIFRPLNIFEFNHLSKQNHFRKLLTTHRLCHSLFTTEYSALTDSNWRVKECDIHPLYTAISFKLNWIKLRLKPVSDNVKWLIHTFLKS